MRNFKLFVYGTLREGHGNHAILGPNARLIAKGTINAELWVSRGGLPMVTETDQPAAQVTGEVWELEDADRLADVDMLEGHPYWYRRQEVPIKIDAADDLNLFDDCVAWAYFMQPAEIIAYGATRVESGDYEKVRSACN